MAAALPILGGYSRLRMPLQVTAMQKAPRNPTIRWLKATFLLLMEIRYNGRRKDQIRCWRMQFRPVLPNRLQGRRRTPRPCPGNNSKQVDYPMSKLIREKKSKIQINLQYNMQSNPKIATVGRSWRRQRARPCPSRQSSISSWFYRFSWVLATPFSWNCK